MFSSPPSLIPLVNILHLVSPETYINACLHTESHGTCKITVYYNSWSGGLQYFSSTLLLLVSMYTVALKPMKVDGHLFSWISTSRNFGLIAQVILKSLDILWHSFICFSYPATVAGHCNYLVYNIFTFCWVYFKRKWFILKEKQSPQYLLFIS